MSAADGPAWLSVGMDDVPEDDDWMDAAEVVRFARMRYPKRRQEARLGRWTAKRTLAAVLGMDDDEDALGRIGIRNAVDGAPEAFVDGSPAGMVIAMTDRADWAVCTVLPGRDRIGCDLELVEPRSPSFVRDYFTTSEIALVQDAAGSDEEPLVANLIWSAKESALKVLRTGLRRDTRSVEVALIDEPGEGWRRLEVTADEGRVFPGWWIRYGEFLLTCAAEVPVDHPASLVDPPGLAAAVPSHGWMASLSDPPVGSG